MIFRRPCMLQTKNIQGYPNVSIYSNIFNMFTLMVAVKTSYLKLINSFKNINENIDFFILF